MEGYEKVKFDHEILKMLRNARLATNMEGDFVFTIYREESKDGKTKVYGPYGFADAMKICWMVFDDFKKDHDDDIPEDFIKMTENVQKLIENSLE